MRKMQEEGKPILQKLLLPQTKLHPSFKNSTETSSPPKALPTFEGVKTSLELRLL